MQWNIKKIAVIGAGSWGTSVARVIAENNHDAEVCMWALEKHVAASINTSHENSDFLPGVPLPKNIRASNNLKEAVKNAGVVLLAPPSKAIYDIANRISRYLDPACHVGFLSKGFCRINNTIVTISQALSSAIPSHKNRIIAISGPSHAEEVCKNLHTCLNVAGTDETSRKIIASLITSDTVQCRELDDVVGVELGGTLKNPAAIAAGMISIMPGCGDNLTGALMSEAMKEMIRLGALFKVKPSTLVDISGLGDLIATALSDHSRNRRFGKDIASQIMKNKPTLKMYERLLLKLKPDLVIQRMSENLHYLAEGAYAIEPLIELAASHDIPIPVYRSLYEVLLNKKDPALLIETIKNPDKFEELYKRTKIQITERQRGLESLSGRVFKDEILSNVEQFLTTQGDDASDRRSIIAQLKSQLNESHAPVPLNEKSVINRITENSFSQSIKNLSRLYVNDIVENHNPAIRGFVLSLLKIVSFFNINLTIKISGSYKRIQDRQASANLVYLPVYDEPMDYMYTLLSISNRNLPLPRFSVRKNFSGKGLKLYLLKKMGGFVVDKEKLSNPVYKETLHQYLFSLLEHGVPVLYSAKLLQDLNSGHDTGFFSLLAANLFRHSVEILLAPVVVMRDRAKNRLIIHYSEPLPLSEYIHKHGDASTISIHIQEVLGRDREKIVQRELR